ncbi:LytTR family DNA-binding domain-containing protein [Niveibacterium sp. 24ML]|uniref:LytR/AlgR family response regulator transcription factor n=1 Tax=Niveibacterium sp. 24ML TaxID=2985512 RepID=UPI00227044D2|nr:LytTR family DNA-binding domain-containing protein [Niveibacterium sp. 24ML]MCX9154591.1 LytTR family DNA-binding domain-containing protein [Niveibacterium sp. 24ML]
MNAVTAPLGVLVVDDEAPARERLRDLLGDIAAQQPTRIVGMAANGHEALRLIEAQPVDLMLVDIRMPGMDGIELAQHVARLAAPPRIVFVTAYDQYAVDAFELNAIDYLLKPVRAQRLEAAIAKVRASMPVARDSLDRIAEPRRHFSVSERGRIALIPVTDVLFLKAELKYVTARTVEREYLLDESLVQLEQEFPERFVRIHRNCLIARAAVAGFERDEAAEHWLVRICGFDEKLPVSRRQWPAVRAALLGNEPGSGVK